MSKNLFAMAQPVTLGPITDKSAADEALRSVPTVRT